MKILLSIIVLGLFIAQPVFGLPVAWTDWELFTLVDAAGGDTAAGTISFLEEISITYEGDLYGVQTDADTDRNYWTEPDSAAAPYTGSDVVDNAPTPSETLQFNSPGTNTITFGKSVVNPLLAILSLGSFALVDSSGGIIRPAKSVSYDFNAPFTVLSEGEGHWGDGTYSLSADDIITGTEFNGVLQFIGTFDSISWTNSPAERWHGVTVGLIETAPVPEPATMFLFGFGLVGLIGVRMVRKK